VRITPNRDVILILTAGHVLDVTVTADVTVVTNQAYEIGHLDREISADNARTTS